MAHSDRPPPEAPDPAGGQGVPSAPNAHRRGHGEPHAHAHPHPHASLHAHGQHDGHGHAHGLAPESATGRAFAAGIALNLAFVIFELGFGLASHSLSLVADASHNFGDVISLVLAGGAVLLAKRSPSAEFTYGLRGSTILAALANAMLLLVVTGGIIWASVDRLQRLAPVAETTVVAVAALGVLVNAGTALFFLRSRHHDLNARGAYLHMAADAGVSLGVIVAALLMGATGWNWLDPVVSIAIALVILVGTWDLLRRSVRLAVQAVPSGINANAVREFVEAQPGVRATHDLHIWAMSTTETAMTAHLVMPAGHPGDAFLEELARALNQGFRVGHVTLQIETGDGGRICSLACEQTA